MSKVKIIVSLAAIFIILVIGALIIDNGLAWANSRGLPSWAQFIGALIAIGATYAIADQSRVDFKRAKAAQDKKIFESLLANSFLSKKNIDEVYEDSKSTVNDAIQSQLRRRQSVLAALEAALSEIPVSELGNRNLFEVSINLRGTLIAAIREIDLSFQYNTQEQRQRFTNEFDRLRQDAKKYSDRIYSLGNNIMPDLVRDIDQEGLLDSIKIEEQR